MPARLRPLEPADLPRVVDLALRAWEPVFTSLRTVLGDGVFLRLYPGLVERLGTGGHRHLHVDAYERDGR